MMTGIVDQNLQPTIRLKVYGPFPRELEVEAIVDTGYNGMMMLPVSLVVQLGLLWRKEGYAFQADGSRIEFDVYTGFVEWDGLPVRVLVDAFGPDALIGMGMLDGYDLTVRGGIGGTVTIQKNASP